MKKGKRVGKKSEVDKRPKMEYSIYTFDELKLTDEKLQALAKLGAQWIQDDTRELANYAIRKLFQYPEMAARLADKIELDLNIRK